VERLFHRDDVVDLNNGDTLPMVLQLTCYTSDFVNPIFDPTLDESLLRREGGGAVATWGSTGQGYSNGHKILHLVFFDQVFSKGNAVIGPVTDVAKATLSQNLDLRDTFILFGDPAMELNLTIVPWSDEIFLPLTLRNSS
jgi:hypothetical protein